MSPKQKAKDLIRKFKVHDYDWIAQGNLYCVKKNAIITVDEILNHHSQEQGLYRIDTYYWQQVKTELQSL